MKTLLLLLILFSGCGKSQCNILPTNCGSGDRYGSQCLTYQEYKNKRYDVSEAVKICDIVTLKIKRGYHDSINNE